MRQRAAAEERASAGSRSGPGADAGKVTAVIDAAVASGVPVMTFDGDAAESKRLRSMAWTTRRREKP